MREKLLLWAAMAAVTLVGAAVISASTLNTEEADLNPFGNVYEVNRGANGDVYVSDYTLGEVWHVASSGVYTLYSGIPTVTDARPDSNGDIWWTDNYQTFGRINIADDTLTTWSFTADTNLYGLAFDDLGRVWLTQYFGSEVYRFDPTTTEVCTYTTGAPSEYILFDDGQIWLGNWGNDRIYRLDPVQDQFTYWVIPGVNPRPLGLALDTTGNLWWVDSGLDAMARLEPVSDLMTIFPLPVGSQPEILTFRNGKIWYTEAFSGAVGIMDPAVAAGTHYTPTRVMADLAPVCDTLGTGTTEAVGTLTGTLSWISGTIMPAYEAAGWTVYELPPGADPYGIADSGDYVWVGDQGRDKLLRLALGPAPEPEVRLQKFTNGQDADAAPGPWLPVGEVVTWTYVVSNSGNVDLTSITVQDDHGTPDDPGDDYVCTVGTLPPGAQDDPSCIFTDTAVAGQYANLATVEGTYGITQVTDVDPSHYFGISTEIDLEKLTNGLDADNPPGPSIAVGQVVTWTYIVTNNSSLELTDVAVRDDHGTPGTPGDDYTCVIGTLAAGAVDETTCILTATAEAGQYQNTATAEGTSGDDWVTDVDLGHYRGVVIAVDLEKLTNGQDADTEPGPEIGAGDPVTWTYIVTNTGDVELTDLMVVDDNGTPADAGDDFVCTLGTLPGGASDDTTCVQSGVAAGGPYQNLATVEGWYGDLSASDSDASHYVGTVPGYQIYLPVVLRSYGP
jgi:streptogramin lyase